MIALAVAVNVGGSAPSGISGQVTLDEVESGPARTVDATVRIDPASAAEDANWVSAIAWQGGEKLHLEHLSESSPGSMRPPSHCPFTAPGRP